MTETTRRGFVTSTMGVLGAEALLANLGTATRNAVADDLASAADEPAFWRLVQAQFRLPNRHKVDRGRVLCTDCHDPHANRDRVRDRDVRVRSCEKCHAEKAGPFLHDHGIKRTEGCIACHAPHGSVNKRMLSHRRIKPLCLQCHAATAHDLSDRRYDNCISCHVEIHGSDVDRYFER